MKIGVISDVHSNYRAFLACIKYMEEAGCDEYLLLGDYVTDSSYPQKTMELLYSFVHNHTCHMLRGNREDYLLGQWRVKKGESEGPLWVKNSASGNLLYTYERLYERDFEFFDSLPITFVYEKEGYPSITCAHGSPGNSRELLELNEEPVKKWLKEIDTDYLLCAHTHRPGVCTSEEKTYINVGCCGLAINDCGYAQCVILQDKVQNGIIKWVPEFIKVPYDNTEVIKEYFESGLFYYAPWFINATIRILDEGIDKAAELVGMATEYATQENGTQVVWPDIDEKYFARAAKNLGIKNYDPRGRG